MATNRVVIASVAIAAVLLTMTVVVRSLPDSCSAGGADQRNRGLRHLLT